MSRPYTTKAQVRSVIDPLYDICVAARDYYYMTGRRRVSISEGGLGTNTQSMSVNPNLSNHKRMALAATVEAAGPHDIEPLIALLAHIPPLRRSVRSTIGRDVSFHLVDENGLTAAVEVDGVWISSHANDLPGDLTNEIYTFIRTHENIEMGPDLHPFRCVPGPARNSGCLWADTADNALLRFAACDRSIRSDIRSGKSYACVQADAPVAQHIKDILNRKTRTEAAQQPENATLHSLHISR